MKLNQFSKPETDEGFGLKSVPAILKHKIKAGIYLTPASIIAVSLLSSPIALAENFGRTSATGTWVDGSWIGSAGGTAPGTSDNVYIYAASVAGSVEPAEVDLGSSATIRNLILGNTQSGTLDILNAGTLSASFISVRNGLLNVQSGGNLSVNDLEVFGATSTATLNGLSSIDSIDVASGATLNADSALSVSSLSAGNGTIKLNAYTNTGFLVVSDGSTLTVTADTTATKTYVYGSTLNLDAGTLTGRLNLHHSGGAAQVNQNGGHVDLTDLTVAGVTSITVGADDNISNKVNLSNGATLNADKALNLNAFYLDKSTLKLNADLTADLLLVTGNSAAINRTNAATLDLNHLRLEENGSYDFDGTDSISQSVLVNSGSSFTVNSALSLSSSLTANDGTIEINADTDATNTDMKGSTLNLNAGTLTGSLKLRNLGDTTAQVNQNGGHVDLTDLTVAGATSITVGTGDNISRHVNLSNGAALNSLVGLEMVNVDLSTSSTFTFTQTLGETEGLSIDRLRIDAESILDLQFDSSQESGLDWALRLSGNKGTDLQAFLDGGLVTFSGGNSPIGIIYDTASYGDYTYLGYVPAVPLPGAFPMMMFGVSALGFFTRRKSVRLNLNKSVDR